MNYTLNKNLEDMIELKNNFIIVLQNETGSNFVNLISNVGKSITNELKFYLL